MKATFKVTFLLQKGKIKANGKAPIVTRIIVNGEMAHFSTQQEIEPDRAFQEAGSPGWSLQNAGVRIPGSQEQETSQGAAGVRPLQRHPHDELEKKNTKSHSDSCRYRQDSLYLYSV